MSDAEVLPAASTATSIQPECYGSGSEVCFADSQGNLSNSFGCAPAEYNNPNQPVAEIANGCNGRVWLHQFTYPDFTNNNGWAYCISPGGGRHPGHVSGSPEHPGDEQPKRLLSRAARGSGNRSLCPWDVPMVPRRIRGDSGR